MYTSSPWYDVMQVCLNGHMITSAAQSRPERRQRFCKDCGEKTIDACSVCNTNIRGLYHAGGRYLSASPRIPKYCIECGAAYPWQTAALENLNEIWRESDLSQQDLDELTRTLPDVLRDTPRTESASLKMKRIMGKLGKPVYDIAIKVVTDVASETAKKTLGLG